MSYTRQKVDIGNKTMWWGYVHQNSTLQLKRWFGDVDDYTTDCEDNEFVKQVVTPFEADNHIEALKIFRARLMQ